MVNSKSTSTDTGSKRGGFLGLFTTRQSKKAVVKADLGGQNKFVYDQKQKRWIEKGRENEQIPCHQFLAPPPNRNDVVSHSISPELSFTELPDKSGVSFNRSQISQKYVQSQFETTCDAKCNTFSALPSPHRQAPSNIFLPRNSADDCIPNQSLYSLYNTQQGGDCKRSKRTKINPQQSHTMHEYNGEQDLYASVASKVEQHVDHEATTDVANTTNHGVSSQLDNITQNFDGQQEQKCSDDAHIPHDGQHPDDEFQSSPFKLDQNQQENSSFESISSNKKQDDGSILSGVFSTQHDMNAKNGFSHYTNLQNQSVFQNGKIFSGIVPQQQQHYTGDDHDLLASDVDYLDDRNHDYDDVHEDDQYLDQQTHGYVDLQNQQDMHDMQSSDAYTHYMEWMNNRWQSYVINLSIEEQNKLQKDNQYYESHFNDWVGQVYIQYYQLYPDYYDQLFIQPSKNMHAFDAGDDDEDEQKSPLEQQQKINQLEFDLNYDRTASDSSSSTIEHYPSLDSWMLKDSLIMDKKVRNRKEGKLHGPTPWENQENWVINEELEFEFEGDRINSTNKNQNFIQGAYNNAENSNQNKNFDSNSFHQKDTNNNHHCINSDQKNDNQIVDSYQQKGVSQKKPMCEKKVIFDQLNVNQLESNDKLNMDLSPISRDLTDSLFASENLLRNQSQIDTQNQDLDNQLFQTNIENPLFDLRTSSFTSQNGNYSQEIPNQDVDQSGSTNAFFPHDENHSPADTQPDPPPPNPDVPHQKNFELSLNQLDELSQNLAQQIQITGRGDLGSVGMRPPTPNNQDVHSPISLNISMSSTPRDCFSPPSDDPPSHINALQQRLQQPCSSHEAEQLEQQLQSSREQIRSHQIQITDLLVALGQESAKVSRLREMLLERGVDEEEIQGVLEIVEEEVGWGEQDDDEDSEATDNV